jgi:transposase
MCHYFICLFNCIVKTKGTNRELLGPKLKMEVVKRSDKRKGFHVLPRRWVVERTFGWFMRHHRLVRDYETTEYHAEAFIYVAMIRLQLRRLA